MGVMGVFGCFGCFLGVMRVLSVFSVLKCFLSVIRILPSVFRAIYPSYFTTSSGAIKCSFSAM